MDAFAIGELARVGGSESEEVVDAVEKISGKKVHKIFGDRRVGDPPILIAEANKAKKQLKWEPKNSSIENIVSTAWNWHQQKT